ncbi:MAG: polysaccharide pyruvyl transferase family protein [Erysipelotrichaceae bacterium]|nr:polysaccharide pyruvyl transferase family protein [Erysipelotrichaceae bacterium]
MTKDLLYPLRAIHGKVYEWRSNRLPLVIDRLKNPHAVYLVMTPEHRNLGDHAIAQAEIRMLKELNIPYIEYSDKKIRSMVYNKTINNMNGRVILITGGGNFGTLWPGIDLMMQEIVKSNPDSTVFFMPNTLYFSDDDNGRQALSKAKELYNSHRSLTIYAREAISYESMKSQFRNVKLVPDMVLSMNQCKDDATRSGCIVCLRSDHERTRSEEQESILREQISELFGENTADLDMVRENAVSIAERNAVLEEQYNAFRHAELVVTDRLHGMIFSAITGTPCIVINSKSPKVRGCYEWIRHLDYIQFCDDVSRIKDIYEKMEKEKYEYDNNRLRPFYDSLKKDLLQAVRRK